MRFSTRTFSLLLAALSISTAYAETFETVAQCQAAKANAEAEEKRALQAVFQCPRNCQSYQKEFERAYQRWSQLIKQCSDMQYAANQKAREQEQARQREEARLNDERRQRDLQQQKIQRLSQEQYLNQRRAEQQAATDASYRAEIAKKETAARQKENEARQQAAEQQQRSAAKAAMLQDLGNAVKKIFPGSGGAPQYDAQRSYDFTQERSEQMHKGVQAGQSPIVNTIQNNAWRGIDEEHRKTMSDIDNVTSSIRDFDTRTTTPIQNSPRLNSGGYASNPWDNAKSLAGRFEPTTDALSDRLVDTDPRRPKERRIVRVEEPEPADAAMYRDGAVELVNELLDLPPPAPRR